MAKTQTRSASSVPIVLVHSRTWKDASAKFPAEKIRWMASQGFTAKEGTFCAVPDRSGYVTAVYAGVPQTLDIWSLAGLASALPEGNYHLETQVSAADADNIMLGWLLGSYYFDRYKKSPKHFAVLAPPPGCNIKHVRSMADAINQARTLINTPPNDMGPAELADACRLVADSCGADYTEIVGEDLVRENYPAVYAVGKASARAPRLIDMRWGDARAPKVTLVGKGVCFDTGGLDIKSSSGMKLMKKDMGGAACVLALGRMIMEAELPVRLRVLIPAVENSISGNAYRTSDVINTRKGITVEIGNTDAEGRIILCDALCEADREKPDLLIDCATLTGAARVALGTDIPALFTPDDALAADLATHSKAQHDPLWRLPLWNDYRDMLKSPVADINSAPDGGYAGAITAALYLSTFVEHTASWAHIDMMAWNLSKRPGRPQGGEAMTIRALLSYIEARFGARKSGRQTRRNT